MNSRSKVLFISFIALSLIGTIVTFIFNNDAPPVADLKIPKSTSDFFKKLSDLSHIKINLVDSLNLDDYYNSKDYGSNESDFKKIEDENFIVFYRDSNRELERANKTLKYANQAIAPLSSFFGKYYYAKDTKNRKLSIYLAISADDFGNISQKIGGSKVDWAAGLTFNSFSSNGDKKCEGILLNSDVQDKGSADLKTVLFHEMAHYNHFQCLDLIRKNGFMNWEVEGLACYFAKDWNKQIPSNININDYNLKIDPSNYADSYWMGYHVFAVFEEKYANSGFKNMLTASFSKSLEISIPEASNDSFDAFQNDWRNHCDRLKGQITAVKKQIQ
jgi:hypothetical protein